MRTILYEEWRLPRWVPALGIIALGCRAAEPPPSVEIVQPANGNEITGPVLVVLRVHGVAVVPAGTQQPNSGHHHLLIDTDLSAPGQPIPAGTPGIVHLGGAQTEFRLEDLPPGEHRVIAQFGDWQHVPVESVAADTVIFVVRK
jgi:hypothetical protein